MLILLGSTVLFAYKFALDKTGRLALLINHNTTGNFLTTYLVHHDSESHTIQPQHLSERIGTHLTEGRVLVSCFLFVLLAQVYFFNNYATEGKQKSKISLLRQAARLYWYCWKVPSFEGQPFRTSTASQPTPLSSINTKNPPQNHLPAFKLGFLLVLAWCLNTFLHLWV